MNLYAKFKTRELLHSRERDFINVSILNHNQFIRFMGYDKDVRKIYYKSINYFQKAFSDDEYMEELISIVGEIKPELKKFKKNTHKFYIRTIKDLGWDSLLYSPTDKSTVQMNIDSFN